MIGRYKTFESAFPSDPKQQTSIQETASLDRILQELKAATQDSAKAFITELLLPIFAKCRRLETYFIILAESVNTLMKATQPVITSQRSKSSQSYNHPTARDSSSSEQQSLIDYEKESNIEYLLENRKNYFIYFILDLLGNVKVGSAQIEYCC